jgi:hypothetical protein
MGDQSVTSKGALSKEALFKNLTQLYTDITLPKPIDKKREHALLA